MTKPENEAYNVAFGVDQAPFFDLVTLNGLRSHSMYWEEGTEVEINCLDPIVRWLYKGDVLLS